MQPILTLLHRVSRFLTYLSATAGVVMCVFIILSSTMRYVVGAPFRFTEEIVGLLFSALVFLLLPVAEVENRHIRVTAIVDLLPTRWQVRCDLAAGFFTVTFAIAFGLLSFDFAALSYQLRSESEMGGILLYPWMALMPLASGLLALAVVLRRLDPKQSARRDMASETPATRH